MDVHFAGMLPVCHKHTFRGQIIHLSHHLKIPPLVTFVMLIKLLCKFCKRYSNYNIKAGLCPPLFRMGCFRQIYLTLFLSFPNMSEILDKQNPGFV